MQWLWWLVKNLPAIIMVIRELISLLKPKEGRTNEVKSMARKALVSLKNCDIEGAHEYICQGRSVQTERLARASGYV